MYTFLLIGHVIKRPKNTPKMALKVNPDLLVRKVVKSLVHWSVI